MLRNFNLQDRFTVSLIIIALSFFALVGPLSTYNIIFWLSLGIVNFGLKIINFKFKTILSAILVGVSVYLQFIFDFETLTKEFFVHLLGVLMIFKFFELKAERDYYFYINLSFFISVISLLDGQDIISCFNSLLIMLFGIYLLYIINQIKFPEFKFKNLIKIFSFVLALVPFIVATYLVFPRTNININILGSTQNKIGIPERISLGSFNSITNTRDKIFDVNFNGNQFNQKEFYFRVKVFDLINKNNTWLSMPGSILNSIKTTNRKITPDIQYDLIMFAHDKKWIPVMDYIYELDRGYYIHPVNFTAYSNLDLQKPKKFQMKSSKMNYVENLDAKSRQLYTKITKENFPRLAKWAEQNKKSDPEEYLNTILEKIQNEEYFYTLTPKVIGNNYDAFFFDTKEGYCEHYAGVFAILSRLANIPSRIVTGYYGGEFNEVGNFYTFRQSDAHSWVEIFIDQRGWVRYDPTNIIPLSRVSQNNNLFVDTQVYQDKESKNNLDLKNKFYNQLNKVFQYFTFIDYKWTNFFLSYNQLKQKELYRNFKDLDKNNINKFGITLVFALLGMLMFYATYFLIYKKINNSNFIIYEILKILRKKKIDVPLNADIELIFDQFRTFKNDVITSSLERVYIDDKFKNKKMRLIDKFKFFLHLKKIALTN